MELLNPFRAGWTRDKTILCDEHPNTLSSLTQDHLSPELDSTLYHIFAQSSGISVFYLSRWSISIEISREPTRSWPLVLSKGSLGILNDQVINCPSLVTQYWGLSWRFSPFIYIQVLREEQKVLLSIRFPEAWLKAMAAN